MIRLLTAVLLLTYSLFGWASAYPNNFDGVPHPNFQQGDVIDHEKFNANNLSIKNAINTLLRPGQKAIALVSDSTSDPTISLTANGGTNSTIVVANKQGAAEDSIELDSTQGGITLSASIGITLNPGIDGNGLPSGNVTANGNVTVVGDVTASGSVTANAVINSSDARLKEAVSSVGVGLGLINDLNPVRYHRINNPESDIEMGLMAQEVKATLAKHGLGNSGMVVQPDEQGYLYLRYNDLLAPMIKAIQELDDASEAKGEQIASLQQKLESQQEELLAIVQSQQEQIAQLQKLVEHRFASN
jgi:hypothetical protein